MNKTDLTVVGILIGLFALIALGIYFEVSLWKECLRDHSWFYCARVLA